MRRNSVRLVMVALLASTAVMLSAASAQSYRRPSDAAISSPEGGVFQVCRNGITFQLADVIPDGDRPTEPTSSRGFTVYSPVPQIDPTTGLLAQENGQLVGGSIVAQGNVTLQLQAVPFEAAGTSFWYLGTHTATWANGRLLNPAPQSLFVDVAGGNQDRSGLINLNADPPLLPYDIDDCFVGPPVNTALPSIAGSARAGSTLTAGRGSWTGAQPIGYAYRWRRCDSAGGNCTDLGGTSASYTATNADVGKRLRVVVTATNSAGTASATSAPTAQITSAGGGGGGGTPPRCGGRTATVVGTPRNDNLRGTSRRDVIVGLGGNDRISGGRGNDVICGGSGKDRVSGNSGNDSVSGNGGNDTLSGNGGNDSLSGNNGNDTLSGGSGRDKLNGGSGRDVLRPGAGRDVVSAGGGNDTVFARGGQRDRIDCGPGRDRVNADRVDVLIRCELVSRPRRR